jgi:hypothetical protein
MQNAQFNLTPGLFADVAGEWRILVVETDPYRAGVFYLGSYPYDADGHRLHPDTPALLNVWDKSEPGARQISERQKRIAHFMTTAIFEPAFGRFHA